MANVERERTDRKRTDLSSHADGSRTFSNRGVDCVLSLLGKTKQEGLGERCEILAVRCVSQQRQADAQSIAPSIVVLEDEARVDQGTEQAMHSAFAEAGFARDGGKHRSFTVSGDGAQEAGCTVDCLHRRLEA